MQHNVDAAIAALRSRGLDTLPPLGIVLGSGLGPFADEASEATAISYADIPGFPVPSVEGHAGRLVVGRDRGEAGRAVPGSRPLLRARRRQRDAGRDRDVSPPRRARRFC